MYYNENYEIRQKEEQSLLKKWERALNADGGIADEHMARTTAICLENYLEYLHGDPRLIAEDRIATGAFTGVNLALLGLIARVIPNLIGAELVGIQAMPTPRSPIFTIRWEKDNAKGQTAQNEEMWVTPVSGIGLDPNYTSQIVNETVALDFIGALTNSHTLGWANVNANYMASKPYLYASTMYVTMYDAAGVVLADYKFVGAYDGNLNGTLVGGAALQEDDTTDPVTLVWTASTRVLSIAHATKTTIGGTAIASIIARYEYIGEGEPNMPEMSFSISEATVELIRRQLRGKYTMDSAYDLKKLHGVNLDSELANMMKVELQAEINREIVGDLRMLAGINEEFDYADFVSGGVSTTHNYDDAALALMDAINIMASEIHVQGRLGKGNFCVGNPVTLAFLDRVTGFVGSGISYNGRDLGFAGTQGGRMKFYHDPLFPKGELLIGYKGAGAIDTGYIHCPYLPITATPTLINPETGDPSKIFYTRYGKTFLVKGGSVKSNLILNGTYQYARLTLKGIPTPLVLP